MNWVKEAANGFYYIGNCKTGLDDAQFIEYISDATDMAQLVEASETIGMDKFRHIIDYMDAELEEIAHQPGTTFGVNQDRHIAWMYDNANDTHYFFA